MIRFPNNHHPDIIIRSHTHLNEVGITIIPKNRSEKNISVNPPDIGKSLGQQDDFQDPTKAYMNYV
jgi:tRNA(Ser,Leu) C12 N-acetylase TAN1